jgi:hypothetical protein
VLRASGAVDVQKDNNDGTTYSTVTPCDRSSELRDASIAAASPKPFITMLNPDLASRSAMPRPMPLVEPVIRAQRRRAELKCRLPVALTTPRAAVAATNKLIVPPLKSHGTQKILQFRIK